MSRTGAFDRTVALMRDRMNLSSMNHQVIASNVANLNTPRYAAKKLAFEQTLQEAVAEGSMPLTRTSSRHLDPQDPVSALQNPEVIETGPVSLDDEMTQLAQNSLDYMFMVTLLNKKFNALKQAIEEGGK